MTNTTLLLIIGTAIVAGWLVFKLLLNLYRKPILEITLSPLDHPRWSDLEKITGLIDSFLRNGFEPAGNYGCREIPALIVSGFVQPSEQLAGVIYDHPTAGIWADLYVQYTDGGSLTVSSAAMGHELDSMPQQTKIYCPGNTVDELLKRLLAERKDTGRQTITREEFSSHFEESYEKEMKWRADRGGPTSLEVMRVANAMGESLDTEGLQQATQKTDQAWSKEKSRPRKKKGALYEPVLPKGFQQPETFRREMERKSAPIPRLTVPALPVYLVFIFVLAYWSYYGYQYNETHYPVSLTAVILFFAVVLVLVVALVRFHEYHRQVRLCPLLKRTADLRPGAFLVIQGSSPSLFYARESWIGKLSFIDNIENENTFTRLDAVTKHSTGSLTISRNSLIQKVIGWSDKETIPLPESDFTRKFSVSGTDTELAVRLLNTGITDALLRLADLGRPLVLIHGNSVSIETGDDLSRPRKEEVLGKFLEEAERIVEGVAQQTGQP